MSDSESQSELLIPESGSFRDRNGRIMYAGNRVYRGLRAGAYDEWIALSRTQFFRHYVDSGSVVQTREIGMGQFANEENLGSWSAMLEHERVPFISYPYEWSFSMLKNAALLQLQLLDAALLERMSMKDASSFNIQWTGSRPVFIDITSFERCKAGDPWAGYLQFCKMYLYPLILQAYKNIPFHPLLRGNIDGIEPAVMRNLVTVLDYLRPGIFADVYLQAKLQKRYAKSSMTLRADLGRSGFSAEMIRSNVGRLKKIINGLKWAQSASEWSEYTREYGYAPEDAGRKSAFVEQALREKKSNLVWDLGCNTGTYSRLASKYASYVVAMDSDHLAIERLYDSLSNENCRTILPLVMNLADPSPALGWRSKERKSLPERGNPDCTLCLALTHHLVIGGNIPLRELIGWLCSLGGDLVIEFVSKQDPMTQRLLRNKDDQYHDYDVSSFEQYLREYFAVVSEPQILATGTRLLYFCRNPRE